MLNYQSPESIQKIPQDSFLLTIHTQIRWQLILSEDIYWKKCFKLSYIESHLPVDDN